MYLLIHEDRAKAAAVAARLEHGGASTRVVHSVAELRLAAAEAPPRAILVSLATQEGWAVSLERSDPAVADAPALFIGGRIADVYELFKRRWFRGLACWHLEDGSPDEIAKSVEHAATAPTKIPGARWWIPAGGAVLLTAFVAALAAPSIFPRGSARHSPAALLPICFLCASLPPAVAARRQGLKVPLRHRIMIAFWGLLLVAWIGLGVMGALGG